LFTSRFFSGLFLLEYAKGFKRERCRYFHGPSLKSGIHFDTIGQIDANLLWFRSAGLQPLLWLANMVHLLGCASSDYVWLVLFLAFVRYQQTSISKTVLPNTDTQDTRVFIAQQW